VTVDGQGAESPREIETCAGPARAAVVVMLASRRAQVQARAGEAVPDGPDDEAA
jgi:hypothetical protein